MLRLQAMFMKGLDVNEITKENVGRLVVIEDI